MIRFLLLLLALPVSAQAFPEMVRHGYVSCNTCHVSPSGGGLMTAYGRSMSKEILSRWSKEGEENVLHGAIKKEALVDWINGNRDSGFNIGGDARYLQTRKSTPFVSEGKWIQMQMDVEAAAKYKNFSVVGTMGSVMQDDNHHAFDSRRLYGLYQVSDALTVRAGRFMPLHGLMIPDHNMQIRTGLQFNQGQERNAAEVNYIHDSWGGTLTYSKSPESEQNREEALGAHLSYAFLEKYKVGLNYWHGNYEDDSSRDIYGFYGIWGFTHEIYALTEVDYQKSKTGNTGAQEGLYYYQKLGYEFTRGLHLVLQLDGAQTDLRTNASKTFAYGAGLMFFPRPHFDFQGFWTRTKINQANMDEFDFAYIMLHYYL